MSSATPATYGWSEFFAAQCSPQDLPLAARVLAAHKGGLEVAGAGFAHLIPPFVAAGPDDPRDGTAVATVGDWLVLTPDLARARRLLPRRSLFRRKAAHEDRFQPVVANVDTLFVVAACTRDFNPARIERYLALALEAGVTPVIVLTKADQAKHPEALAAAASGLMPGLAAHAVDARRPEGLTDLAPYLGPGQTVAFVGSSGVGKSTLVNSLSDAAQETQAARADDDRGRHTTTGRSMHRARAGGWLVDTPGMRELGLAEAGDAVEALFADLVALAATCRFSDCRHAGEPGCALAAGVAAGTVDPARIARWQKLAAEDRAATATLAERRARSRSFGRRARDALVAKRSREEW